MSTPPTSEQKWTIPVGILLFLALAAWAFMYTWNWLVPQIGGPAINYWLSCLFVLIVRCLTGAEKPNK